MMANSSPAKADMGSSKFKTTMERNTAAKKCLGELFDSVSEFDIPELDFEEAELLQVLVHSLVQEPPEASQAAEGALTILALTLAEGRVLDLRQRVPGDRSLGDWLCRDLLQPKNIPSTQGPFQSSSFRGGYTSDQVRSTGLRRFVSWYAAHQPSMQQVYTFAAYLTKEFSKQSTQLLPLPEIAASRLTFLNFALFHDRLISVGSGGAFEQYLLAGLLEQELKMTGNGHRIQTKNVGSNDAATHAGGDIEVRHGQTLLKAYEVTANDWATKISQLNASAKAGLTEVTVVAKGVSTTSPETLNDLLKKKTQSIGIDVSVLDLENILNVLSSRITPHARAEVIAYVYGCLTRWHRRQPGLVARLIEVLRDLDLVVAGAYSFELDTTVDISHIVATINVFLNDLDGIDGADVPRALRRLADDLETDSKAIPG